ncbi:uncharacterized protein EDB91DRAFT_1089688 [Suillus paluster]|uniref:uncharacterized protein n=1 Tax=Suillus paluster TaxID=48578 RepID=UPI001B879B6F|nr:uncharacterized protein EDB91DRAFT_1089688 [Suillus paluster]KAG1718896.1 hypothetical protein EDB91DRAFT_1089688 [Suillus paluster]
MATDAATLAQASTADTKHADVCVCVENVAHATVGYVVGFVAFTTVASATWLECDIHDWLGLVGHSQPFALNFEGQIGGSPEINSNMLQQRLGLMIEFHHEMGDQSCSTFLAVAPCMGETKWRKIGPPCIGLIILGRHLDSIISCYPIILSDNIDRFSGTIAAFQPLGPHMGSVHIEICCNQGALLLDHEATAVIADQPCRDGCTIHLRKLATTSSQFDAPCQSVICFSTAKSFLHIIAPIQGMIANDVEQVAPCMRATMWRNAVPMKWATDLAPLLAVAPCMGNSVDQLQRAPTEARLRGSQVPQYQILVI